MKVGVLGAGAIGAFFGSCTYLALDGDNEVVLVGRNSLMSAVEQSGNKVIVKSLEGVQGKWLQNSGNGEIDVQGNFVVTADASKLEGCDIVLVAVKTQDTLEAGDILAKHIPDSCVVISLQNGVTNPKLLREKLPKNLVLAGMVGFNVVWLDEGAVFQRGVGDTLYIEQSDVESFKSFAEAMKTAKFNLQVRNAKDMQTVMYSKLLINLGNAPNALSGRPIATMLRDSGYRKLFAATIAEALRIYSKAGIKAIKLHGANPKMIPFLFRLPDPIWACVQKFFIKNDESAKSSMLQDLEKGKLTEVDYLCGEIVNLAKEHGMTAPVNQRVVELIHKAEEERQANMNESWKGYPSKYVLNYVFQ